MAGNRLPNPPIGVENDLTMLPRYLTSLVSAVQGLIDRLLLNYQPRYRPYLLQPVTVAMIMGTVPSVKPGIVGGAVVGGALVFVTNPTGGTGLTQPRPAFFDGLTWRFCDDLSVVS